MQSRPKPLRLLVLGDLQEIVREKNPASLQEIVDIVTKAAASMERSKVIRATQNFRRKVELCRKKKGGHFEAKVKVPKIKITEKQISISIVINKKIQLSRRILKTQEEINYLWHYHGWLISAD